MFSYLTDNTDVSLSTEKYPYTTIHIAYMMFLFNISVNINGDIFILLLWSGFPKAQ